MSLLETILAADLDRLGIEYQREFKFEPTRRWRADFAFARAKLLVEVEGGAGFGRHSRREGFIADGEKYAAAARMGWVVLRFTKPQIEGRMGPGMESEAIETIRKAIEIWGEESA